MIVAAFAGVAILARDCSQSKSRRLAHGARDVLGTLAVFAFVLLAIYVVVLGVLAALRWIVPSFNVRSPTPSEVFAWLLLAGMFVGMPTYLIFFTDASLIEKVVVGVFCGTVIICAVGAVRRR